MNLISSPLNKKTRGLTLIFILFCFAKSRFSIWNSHLPRIWTLQRFENCITSTELLPVASNCRWSFLKYFRGRREAWNYPQKCNSLVFFFLLLTTGKRVRNAEQWIIRSIIENRPYGGVFVFSSHHCFLFLFSDIRLQLNEQLRCLDVRMEAQVALVAELQDFFRKRAELELDYSKSLDKMARSIQLRHKEQKQKYIFSSFETMAGNSTGC